MNPAASCPQQARLRRALEREDLLTVVLDLFPTDTTALADYVLPAASFLEFDDLIASYFHLTLSAQVKVMAPCGEALPNQEIFRRLARAMDFSEPALRESDAEMLSTAAGAQRARRGFRIAQVEGHDLDPERDGGAVRRSGIRHAERAHRNRERERRGGRTAAAGAMPVRTAAAAGLLRLLTPAHAWLLNTSFGNVGKIRARLGPASIALHPADAAERRLTDGDTALVHNDERPARIAGHDLGSGAARRRARAQGPMARDGSGAGQRQCVESGRQERHGREQRRAQRAGRGAARVPAGRAALSTTSGAAPGLKRSLRYWDLVLYGLAYIAPFAPLSTLGFVWNESNGLIVLAYLLGGVCMYFTARSYATMTELLPTAGSVYGFARQCLGPLPGIHRRLDDPARLSADSQLSLRADCGGARIAAAGRSTAPCGSC